MDKLATPNIAADWGRSNYGSYLNTINPVSQLFGGIDRLPAWYVDLFPNTEGGQRAAHMTFKSGAAAILAAGLVGGARALQHYGRMTDLAKSDNPANKMVSNISTTFEGDMTPSNGKKKEKGTVKKAAKNTNMLDTLATPGSFDASNFYGAAIPLGATILAASLAYKKVDDYYDEKRNKALDEAIAAKENAVKQLITTRARIGRANASGKEVANALNVTKDPEFYVKTANLPFLHAIGESVMKPVNKLNDVGRDIGDAASNATRKLTQGVGILSSLIMLASAIGMYEYAGSRDENNIRYKALKKGLEEYTKNKSGYTPITVVPTDATKYFGSIDNPGAEVKKKPAAKILAAAATPQISARQEPAAITEDYNKPISITL